MSDEWKWLDDIGLDEPAPNPCDVEIYYLDLSTRLYNVLKSQLECKTLGDVIQYSKMDILRTPNCGRKSYEELIEVLERYGLELSKENKFDYRPTYFINLGR